MAKQFWNENVETLLRVNPGFDLRTVDPDSTPGTALGKRQAADELDRTAAHLRLLQEQLFAQSRAGAPDRVLVVLQALGTAGKGDIVNRVFSVVDPNGIELTAFKAPTPEEQAHDFLWRIEPRVPSQGMIGIFDRSHYEDVLTGRVHGLAPPEEIERRYDAITHFERRLASERVRIVKIMLHISPEEQSARLLDRLTHPDKHWHYRTEDVDERKLWPAHMEAFQAVFDRTSTPHAPWYVVPANSKWYARVAVQRIVVSELEQLHLAWPPAEFDPAAERARVEATVWLRWPARPLF